MMHKLFISFFLSGSLPVFSQNANESLAQYLKEADTVLLTSHENLRLDIEKPGKKTITQIRPLLKNNRPNGDIIRKQVILSPERRQEMIDMIKNQKKDKYWDGAHCFEPHHTVFICKGNKWENIDLCFGCDHYSFTPGIPVSKKEFLVTYQDWRALEAFFTRLELN
ncbi:hypothetical protein [Chryseobacterium arthrosphaerae]|uniref:hypothetical protein n=1 Tax=Chryseobacterium arthrosphaerae TaxID=651561 RepID=UPI001F4A6A85|nr:hypothetical protein [Chryseobacterium arthrosphaerae]MDG4650964.1 hypothetical protein [Chryseobacterium arthrosphaerae]